MIYIYKKDLLYWAIFFALLFACSLGIAFLQSAYGSSLEDAVTIDAYDMSSAVYLQEGYADQEMWQKDFDSAIGAAEEDIAELDGLRGYLSQEELAKLDNYSPDNFKYIKEVDEFSATLAEMRENAMAERQRQIEQQRAREREQVSAPNNQSTSSSSSSSSSFKSQGVIYQNGIRYTYYSSRVLYHYRTPEWIAGSDGIYRDSNGYIVVASSDHSQGTVVSTPFGAGKVYDSGCASGTIDIYTNF